MSVLTVIPEHKNINVPSFTVTIGGVDVTAKYGVISFMVSTHANRVTVARVVLHDGSASKQDFELSGGQKFVPGVEVEIKAGYAQKEKSIFKGIIVKHAIKAPLHGNSVLTLELRHKAVNMTVIRKNKYHTKDLDSAVIEDLLGQHGVKDIVTPTTSPLKKSLVQYYCTDWDFVLSRAEANGMIAFCTDKGVTIVDPTKAAVLVPFVLKYGDNMIDFEGEVDARLQYGEVDTSGWDPATQKVVKKTSSSASVKTPGSFNGKKVSDALKLDKYTLQHTGALESTELDAWAKNVMMRSRLSLVRGRVRIYGTTAIKPGNLVKIDGLGDHFNGTAFVSGIVHGYDVNGTWTTDIMIGLDNEPFAEKHTNIMDPVSAGLVPGIRGLATGVVTKIDGDPGNEFRIKVRIPVISDSEEGVWARMGRVDAGNERGMIFRPEVNDEVILGFINDDPREPVILGMVHSGKNKAPADLKATEKDNDIKGWVTKSKIEVLFDDKKKIVTIKTPGKNSIVIDDDKKSITLEDQNKNKIVMDDKGITLDSGKDIILKAAKGDVKIDGTNIKQKAKSQFKAEGSSGAEVSSSASLTLKGGIVKIN